MREGVMNRRVAIGKDDRSGSVKIIEDPWVKGAVLQDDEPLNLSVYRERSTYANVHLGLHGGQ
ncbi:hypothetical protein N7448_006645 [Penicillium atrosanguineum]|uniref:Uncharacterized protein n=1 Tax=Penicillium atrosanguineum TaxID=1132637 RepID=A0A9W9PS10_9EURO|nr:Homeodomain [Penicillium atrosanguineum]KAJ5132487.1 hypothetical protein N7448_006645 [Penicillium atrosanguineum]KAJ5290153.1 Homeodomain [Penicillium atrosanguineum]KAJ5307977.1 hypothetical protein N7476_008633 [Penicillium atrosanguineum]